MGEAELIFYPTTINSTPVYRFPSSGLNGNESSNQGEHMDIPLHVQAWQKERENRNVSFDSFQAATEVFGGDLSIVNHTDHPTTSILGKPNDYGTYSLSQIPEGMTEQSLLEALQGNPVVVFIECMDKLAARPAYDQLKAEHPEAVIVTLSMGGGILQEDVIRRPQGNKINNVQVWRGEAIKTQLAYLEQLVGRAGANVEVVVSTGHDCQCGACKFYNNDVAVHENIGAQKGSEEEQNEMKRLITEHTAAHMPQAWLEAGIVKTGLVRIDEAGQKASTEYFN